MNTFLEPQAKLKHNLWINDPKTHIFAINEGWIISQSHDGKCLWNNISIAVGFIMSQFTLRNWLYHFLNGVIKSYSCITKTWLPENDNANLSLELIFLYEKSTMVLARESRSPTLGIDIPSKTLEKSRPHKICQI